jgi:hypothetical protein
MIDVREMLAGELRAVLRERGERGIAALSTYEVFRYFEITPDEMDHMIDDAVSALHDHMHSVATRVAFRLARKGRDLENTS